MFSKLLRVLPIFAGAVQADLDDYRVYHVLGVDIQEEVLHHGVECLHLGGPDNRVRNRGNKFTHNQKPGGVTGLMHTM